MIYILSQDGSPLMPTNRNSKVRKMLKDNTAIIVKRNPFTIQLLRPSKGFVDKGIMGVDSGYKNVGISVISKEKELFSAELTQRMDIVDLLKIRSDHRGSRRSRLRYRKARFNNRVGKRKKHSTDEIWLPPSIQHKLDVHLKIIDEQIKILPINRIIIETASFDTQKIINPDIQGEEYQEGNQLGFVNVRQYILFRDGYKCQNEKCKNKDSNQKLHVHHIVFKRCGGTDRPSNLITLCNKCHTAENHEEGGFLYEWMISGKMVNKALKAETFMSIVNKHMIKCVKKKYPDIEVKKTYGYITKHHREQNNLEKSHHTDAFIIAGGNLQERSVLNNYKYKIIRRNNRCLTTFQDSKFIDIRDSKEKTGSELNSGRTCRNKNNNTENLRKYRGKRIRKGQNTASKKNYSIKNGTIIKITEDWSGKYIAVKKNQIYVSSGHTGRRNIFIKAKNAKTKKPSIPEKICIPVFHKKGLVCS